MKRQYFVILISFFSLSIIYFLILPLFNLSQFIESLKNTDLLIFCLALIIILLSNAFGAIRWSILMKEVNAPISERFFNAFGCFSLGQIAGLVVPSRVGNYTKVPLVMKLDNISYNSGLSAVNAETILDLAYICIASIASLLILSTFFFSSGLIFSSVLLLLMITLLMGILTLLFKIDHFKEFYEKSCSCIEDANRQIWIRLPAKCIVKLFELSQSTRNIFTNESTVFKLGIFTLFFQLIGILGYFFVIESLHVTLPILTVFAILTISFLVGIISMIPGGLGASDLSLIMLLMSQGISLPVATNITLLFRIAMYLPILAVIGLYLLKQNLSTKPSEVRHL